MQAQKNRPKPIKTASIEDKNNFKGRSIIIVIQNSNGNFPNQKQDAQLVQPISLLVLVELIEQTNHLN